MCPGGDCPLRFNCLRFTAMIAGRQDFFGSPPYSSESGHCQFYNDERPTYKETALAAYFLWEKDGYKSDSDVDYWIQAEQELLESGRKTGAKFR